MSLIDEFPFEKLLALLNEPKVVDQKTFGYVFAWMEPKFTDATTFVEVAVASGIVESRSDVYRKVKEGSMKWNGVKVIDPNMPVKFIFPGWGVVKLGKKQHKVVMQEHPPYCENSCSSVKPVDEQAVATGTANDPTH